MKTKEYLNLAKPLITSQKSFVFDYGKCLSYLDEKSFLYYRNYPSVEAYCKDACQLLIQWQNDGSLEKDMSEQEIMKEIEDA